MNYFNLISYALILIFIENELTQAVIIDYLRKTVAPLKSPEKHTSVEWTKISKFINSPKIDYDPKGTKKAPTSSGKTFIAINPHIVGGNKATRGQFPWQAFIVFDQSGFCSGSLISTLWVLTTAYCVRSQYSFEVTLGANDRSEPEAESIKEITRIKYVHESYNTYNSANDIAVLRFNYAITIASAYINTIQLPRTSDATKNFVATNAIISGWGKTSDGYSISCALRFVQVPVIENSECCRVYGSSIVRPSTLCVSTTGMKSACDGDSGSPLIYEETTGVYTQIGIVSFVNKYGCAAGPTGFTRVTSYLGWISSKTGIAIRP